MPGSYLLREASQSPSRLPAFPRSVCAMAMLDDSGCDIPPTSGTRIYPERMLTLAVSCDAACALERSAYSDQNSGKHGLETSVSLLKVSILESRYHKGRDNPAIFSQNRLSPWRE